MTDLEQRVFRVTALALATRMAAQFDAAEPALSDASTRTLAGALAVEDSDALGEFLIRRLKILPQVDRLLYGSAQTGSFVIATSLG